MEHYSKTSKAWWDKDYQDIASLLIYSLNVIVITKIIKTWLDNWQLDIAKSDNEIPERLHLEFTYLSEFQLILCENTSYAKPTS